LASKEFADATHGVLVAMTQFSKKTKQTRLKTTFINLIKQK
jgi:hypothetical protein